MRTVHYFSPWLKSLATFQKVWAQIEAALTAEDEPYDFVPNAADIWVRDFMPFQRYDGDFVIYRYNPDYLQGKNAKYITNCEEAFWAIGGNQLSSICHQTDLVIDGGNLIRCTDKNGKDCVIMTTKVLYENLPLSYGEILQQLENIFDAEVVFIPWDTHEKYGHSDGMVRSLGKGRLLLNCYAKEESHIGDTIKRVLAHRFEIQELQYGGKHRDNSWCHLNYLELSHAVLVPVASIASDRMALEQIAEITGKKCIPISMAPVVRQGGAMHCISWTMNTCC